MESENHINKYKNPLPLTNMPVDSGISYPGRGLYVPFKQNSVQKPRVRHAAHACGPYRDDDHRAPLGVGGYYLRRDDDNRIFTLEILLRMWYAEKYKKIPPTKGG